MKQGGCLPPTFSFAERPPEDISGRKMCKSRCDLQQVFTKHCHIGPTVQAGTPMTVTGNGTSLADGQRGVSIFRPQISRVGSGEGSALPGLSDCAGFWT